MLSYFSGLDGFSVSHEESWVQGDRKGNKRGRWESNMEPFDQSGRVSFLSASWEVGDSASDLCPCLLLETYEADIL